MLPRATNPFVASTISHSSSHSTIHNIQLVQNNCKIKSTLSGLVTRGINLTTKKTDNFLVLWKLTSDQYSSACLYLSKTPSIFNVKKFLECIILLLCSFELKDQNCLLCQKDSKGHTCQKGQWGSQGPNVPEAL